MTIYAARVDRSNKGYPYINRLCNSRMILMTITRMNGQISQSNDSVIIINRVVRILTNVDLIVCNRLILKILVAVSTRTIADLL